MGTTSLDVRINKVRIVSQKALFKGYLKVTVFLLQAEDSVSGLEGKKIRPSGLAAWASPILVLTSGQNPVDGGDRKVAATILLANCSKKAEL